MKTKLAQLREMTTVVADTGDLTEIKKHQPVDATTNPSLLLAAVQDPDYRPLVARALRYAGGGGSDSIESITEYLSVVTGMEILALIPGRVSIEVAAKYSYDAQQTADAALRLIDLFSAHGVSNERILIKIAATWEGIQAASALERLGIQCNLTLLFNLNQAQACADAGVFLVSPFVGRITDWHKAQTGVEEYHPSEDPGVRSVQDIYRLYKTRGYHTVVMGASFRNIGQIEELVGCDRLTISPMLLDLLNQDFGKLSRKLEPQEVTPHGTGQSKPMDAMVFERAMEADAMASEKLTEGIERFVADHDRLMQLLSFELART